jgi:single-stranded DNA-binding protein
MDKEQGEKAARVIITGRVGGEPRLRTTPKGVEIHKVFLAEHPKDSETVWHTLLGFGEKGQKLLSGLHKGQEIEVIGYPHTRQKPGNDGTLKEITEIYVAVVRTPKK